MYTPLNASTIFKDSIVAGDVVFRNSYLNILNCDTTFPSVFYKGAVGKSRILKSLTEIVSIQTITYTPGNNTTYSFTISQDIYNSGSPITKTISYTSDASGTDAEIATGLVTAVNNAGFQVVASGSASPVTITGNAGYPAPKITAISNVTIASAQTTYTPSGTANVAITSVIAPGGSAATDIAGTSTVTVTTAAAHLLRPGDIVAIASVATMTLTYTDNVPFSATYGKTFSGAAGGTFRVATVPTSTTFTLDGVTASGTNSGTITINTRNVVFITTSGSTTITTGKTLAIAGVATMTVAPIVDNVVGTAGATVTARVGVGGTGTRFLLENVNPNGSLNSGTITITEVAQQSQGNGTVLLAQGYSDATAGNTYSQTTITYGDPMVPAGSTQTSGARQVTLFFNEGDTDYGDFWYALENVLEGRVINTIATPNIGSLVN